MVEAQHQEAIEQVILNLKAQVAGLNQQIEVLSKLLEVKHEDINIDDVPGQLKWVATDVMNNSWKTMKLVNVVVNLGRKSSRIVMTITMSW